MLKNKTINLGVIKKVARTLAELNDQVVYVGGAVVSVYADDPAADDVRPTKDIDIMLRIATFAELATLQDNLAQKGIFPDVDSKINCRFRHDDVLIDIMSTHEVGWAPSDTWFAPGYKHRVAYRVDENTTISIFPVAYFLASKFSAFDDRGSDPRISKDFEDIVYVLDNCLNVVYEVRNAPQDVKDYLVFRLTPLLDESMTESITCHLSPFDQQRIHLLRKKITDIIL